MDKEPTDLWNFFGRWPTINLPFWTATAWQEIEENIIVKSFKRCGISNALDRSEDDQIRNEIPKDIADELDEEEGDEEEDEDDINDFDPFNDD